MNRFSPILVLACLAVVLAGVPSRAQSFDAGRTFAAPTHPNAVAVADFNGDAAFDLAVPSYSPNTLAIMLGDGNGNFASPLLHTVGAGPRFAALADFDSDGRLDVAVLNQDSGDVSLLLATGPGTFARHRRFYSGTLAYHMAVADLNADSRPDVVVANSGGDNISVLLGDGLGNLSAAQTTPVGTTPRGVTTGDFNEDGSLDVVVSNSASNNITLLFGNGTGGFSSTKTMVVGATPYWPATADLNADGHIDIVVPNFGAGTISVLRGDGAGNFTASTIAVGRSPRSIAVADMNHDAVLDLLVTNRDSNTLSVLHGTVAGNFVHAGDFGTGSGPFYPVPVDINRDGELDIVVANRDGHSISLLQGSSAGVPHAPHGYMVGSSPRGVAAGDLNGDGFPDVVSANQASATVSVLFGQGDGKLANRLDLAVKSSPYLPVIGDFDRDGRPDIAVANSGSNSVSVLRGDGAGNFAAQVQSSAGGGTRALAAADFNGDGYLDLASANYNTANASVLLGKGAGLFNAPLTYPAGANPTAVAAGDLNRDNVPDFAIASAGSNEVHVFLANSSGAFTASVAYAVSGTPSAIAILDADRDGWPDLAVSNEASNNVAILRGTGLGAFALDSTRYAVSTRPLAITAGDLTQDNITDLVVACATTNMLSVLAGNGDGTFSAPVEVPAGVFSRAVALADFDNDARLDIVSGHSTGNDVWVVLNRHGAIADLSLSLSNGATGVRRGTAASYAAVVTNLSEGVVTEAKLQLSLPAELESPVLTPSVGSYDATTRVWSGLALAQGQQATLTVSGTVSSSASGTLTVSGTVSSGTGFTDPVGGNNSASDSDLVIRGDADLQVSVTNNVSNVAAGDSATYVIQVANAGPADVPDAQVATTLDATLQNVSWTCTATSGATCAASGSGSISQSVSLPAASSVTFTLAATVDERAAAGTLSVSATAATPADVVDPVTANNSATDEDPLAGDAPPVAQAQSVNVAEDGSTVITVAATDADGDSLTYTIVTQPAHGTLTGTAPEFTYTPAADYSGADNFVFRADDGILTSDATVTITVAAANDAPVANAATIPAAEDTAKAIQLSATDADGDTLTYTITAPPANGSLSGTAPAVTYTPNAEFSGSDSFTFSVSDGQSESSATITIQVAAVNDTPTIVTPIPDLQINGEDVSATVDLAGRYTDVETAALQLSAGSSDASLVTTSISGTTLTLGFAAGRGGSAIVSVRAMDEDGAWVDDSFTVTVTRPGVSLFISDATRGEGSSAGLVYTVSLSGPSTTAVSVNFATEDGTAFAGADYVASSGTLTFAPGVTSRTITVQTIPDVLDELDETVFVQLSAASGATLQNVRGTGTITDDDTATISLQDISVTEGNAGTTAATFLVTLSVPSSREVTVNFATANVSATAGSDYVARTGTVVFPAGSNTAQAVTIDVLGDTTDEIDQAFSLVLSGAVNASISRTTGRATIVDDDAPPVVSIANASITEANSGTRAMVFTVTLSARSEIRARVRYQTVNGTATAGSDYVAKSGEVVFDAGVTSRTISIVTTGDTTVEPTEFFYVDLNTPTSATIGTARGTGTIINND